MELEGQQSHTTDGFSTGTGCGGWRGLLAKPLPIPLAAFSLPTRGASMPSTLSKVVPEKQGNCMLRT